jgi:Mrp family chromosome partitioning ATPase
MSSRLDEFIAEAKQEYDFVLIDTAPVGIVSDTYLIDKHIDATIYVVREGVTPKDSVNFINTQKAEGKLVNMYLVLNDSSIKNHSYRYGYGREYGYRSE